MFKCWYWRNLFDVVREIFIIPQFTAQFQTAQHTRESRSFGGYRESGVSYFFQNK